MTFDDVEPVVMLRCGSAVSRAAYDSLASAQAAGYAVPIDDSGDVWISPSGLHEDVAFVITSNSHDVALMLADQTGRGH
jgi:hypothetical protein